MLELNLEKATSLLDATVTTQGVEYVYNRHNGSCQYFHSENRYDDETGEWVRENERPGCLVGHVLLDLGLTYDDLYEVNTLSADAAMYDLQQRGLLSYTADAEQILSMAQISQDNGVAWGEAVERAKLGQVFKKPYAGESGWISYAEYNSGE